MTPTPEQGARAWLGAALGVLATWAALLALSGLIVGTRWLVVAGVAVLVVGATTALTRALTRRWWVPTLAGAAVAVVGLVLRYGAPPGRPQFLPDLDALRRAWATAQQGVAVVNDSFVPMPDVRPGEMLVVVGAVAVLLLVDAAVLALRVPALAGAPLLALWVPAVVLGFPAGATAVFWTATAYLALLAYGAAPLHVHAGRARRAVVAAVTAAALAGLTVVAGPPLMDAPGWASVSLPTFGSGAVGPLELSDDLDLRDSLGQRSGQVVLTYRVVDPTAGPDAAADDPGADDDAAGAPGPEDADDDATGPPVPEDAGDDAAAAPAVDARLVGPLRAFTLATFDGRLWERTDSDRLTDWDPALLLSSDPALRGVPPSPEAGTLAQVDVSVGALRERRLPLSTFARTLTVEGAWAYDQQRDEVVGERATREGLTYAMQVQVPSLSAADLRGAEVGVPEDAELYTAVPATQHRDDIAALAAELTADAQGPYEQALALQTWLRSIANFTYDTRVPPARSSDAVWDFLEDRRGYCVQFATAMAIMARTLDIPSRVGVGFLPGERNRDGEYVVTGRLAHAWPELYFDGQGWVRFEPTPASQTGPPPVWADPFAATTATDQVPEDDLDAVEPGAAPSAAPTAQPSTPPSSVDDASTPWVPVAVGTAVGTVLLLGAGALVLVARRRRASAASPEHAWTLLRRELARADLRWSDSDSPRAAVRRVRTTLEERTGVPLAGAPLAALEHLATAVEQARYAPTPAPVRPGELDAWRLAVRAGVDEAVASSTARRREQVTAR
ncbi:transglutaminaseTgpA domain-containing protein [Cellulomonas iranensis]|uniref:transglutaminase family protein n=1 Tax=Cellulomonas iranensis TaxID=76862 RepID=UPI003D7C7C19